MSSAVVAAPVPAPQRTLSLAGRRYPVMLPKLRDSRLHVASVTISLHVLGQVGLHFQVPLIQVEPQRKNPSTMLRCIRPTKDPTETKTELLATLRLELSRLSSLVMTKFGTK